MGIKEYCISRLLFMAGLFAIAIPVLADDALNEAIARSDIKTVRARLNAGASVHAISGQRGRTPLLRAARAGNPDIVRLLLDAGAEINFQDVNGTTALHLAVHHGNPELVRLLIERGANPRVRNKRNIDSVQYAYAMRRESPGDPVREDIASHLAGVTGETGDTHNYRSRKGGDKSLIKRGKLIPPVAIEVDNAFSSEDFHSVVRPALRSRKWRIESESATHLRGVYRKMAETYKADVVLDGGRIVIGFVPGFHIDQDKWLRNLERDIRRELATTRQRRPAIIGPASGSPEPSSSSRPGH